MNWCVFYRNNRLLFMSIAKLMYKCYNINETLVKSGFCDLKFGIWLRLLLMSESTLKIIKREE